jgi:bacillolysin
MKQLLLIPLFIATILFNLNAQNKKGFDTKLRSDTLLGYRPNFDSLQAKLKKLNVLSLFQTNNVLIDSTKQSDIKNNNVAKIDETVTIICSKKTDLPLFIHSNKKKSTGRIEFKNDKKKGAYEYLKQLKAHTKIKNPEKDLAFNSVTTDSDGKTHLKMTHRYKGIKIYGSEVIVHLDKNGKGESFNGNYKLINNENNSKPTISPNEAIEIVINDVKTKTAIFETEKPITDTVWYETKTLLKNYVLAYKIEIRPNLQTWFDYFVDAKTGKILDFYNKICHLDGPKTATGVDLNGVNRTLNTFQEGSNHFLGDATKAMFNSTTGNGMIKTGDFKNTYGNNLKIYDITVNGNNLNNPTAVSAHYNASVAYDYFKKVHGRNSIDGNGGDIISYINVVDNGSAYDNASWNGKAMFYGNGNLAFKPLAGGLDVAGHEMTHGVVQNTAGLKYQGESGAINESMADIFGCMMDSTDWLIGEDIVKTSYFPTGAARSLSDPYNGGGIGYQPKFYNEKYNGNEDNGGVHSNSGIVNFAFYKVAIAINSKHRASKIWYRALTTYLTANSQFLDLRLATIQAAKDLYGNNSNEANQVALAFDAVGITNGATDIYTIELPVNPGTEYMLSYDTDNTNANGIYRSSPLGTSFAALTATKNLKGRPSINDAGTVAIFVGKDYKLYLMNTNPSNANSLVVLDNNPVWHSVATSKDGNKIAVTLEQKDTSIYVINLVNNTSKRFKLYGSTYSKDVKTTGPVYADALDWTHNGEYIIYDCFNSLNNANGTSITNWDINLLKVWDNTINTFAGGNIQKIYNNLGPNESIGNPVFSKNSPYVIAFDYFNSSSSIYGIIGMNLETNKIAAIASNNTLGFPSFNKTDTRVAFTNISSNAYNVNYITLNADKISSNGVKTQLISNATYPVYYTVGNRTFPKPNIVLQPQSTTFCANNSAVLVVSVSGTGFNTYKWSNGETTKNITVNNQGYYNVTVSGMFGNTISNTVFVSTIPVTTILSNPVSQTVCGGNFVNFNVSATGNNLSYLWNTNNQTSGISTSITGSYLVTVTGTCGKAVSSIANLSNRKNTLIVTQPISVNTCNGVLVSFSTSALGENLIYQWNNGIQNASFVTSISGNYFVTVSGSCGNLISNVAILNIIDCNSNLSDNVATISGLQISNSLSNTANSIKVTISSTNINAGATATIGGVALTNVSIIGTNALVGTIPAGSSVINPNNPSVVVQNTGTLASTSTNLTPTVTDVLESVSETTVIIYPNPNKGSFTVSSNSDTSFQIYSLEGALLQAGNLIVGENTITTKLGSGFYFIRVGNITQKLLVE